MNEPSTCHYSVGVDMACGHDFTAFRVQMGERSVVVHPRADGFLWWEDVMKALAPDVQPDAVVSVEK